VSGFLGFREIDVYRELPERIKTKHYYPEVLFVDRFGILHHREIGSACQIGLEFDIRTIGIAKTLLYLDGLDENVVKAQFRNICKVRGDFINLIGVSGKFYGAALKTSIDTLNPMYVSIRHKISLASSIKLVIKTCLFKNPEPIRNSDTKSKLYL
jgi:deoxyinosine 3'endonuclease (endonuclease V)